MPSDASGRTAPPRCRFPSLTSVQTHMGRTGSRENAIDLRNPVDRAHAVRIGNSWIDLRRGPATTAIREYMMGATTRSSRARWMRSTCS